MGIVDTIGSVFNPFHRLVEPMASTLATLPREVVLRSGQRVPFDAERIRAALASAGQASGEYGADEAALLTAQVTKVLIHRFQGEAPTIEQIQDVAEQTLIAANHLATARAYIVYREQHATLRADKQTLVDVESSINEYLTRADWRVNANANQGYSLGGLILNVAGKVTANYWLSHVYTPEIGEAHRNGDIHIHDLDMLSGYCAGWSLRTLLHEGLNGVPGKVEAGPPKHMSSAVGQIVNFLGTLQNEWAGAQAFSSFSASCSSVTADLASWRFILPAPAQACRAAAYTLHALSPGVSHRGVRWSRLLGQFGGLVKLIPIVVHAACLIIRSWGACPP